MFEFAVLEGCAKERQRRDIPKEKGLLHKMKGGRFDLPTRTLTQSTMTQCAFEIDELARLDSCYQQNDQLLWHGGRTGRTPT